MRYQNPRTNRNRAFTLIELLMVMVILAILAAVVVPRIVGRGEDAKVKAAKTDISNLESALNTFEVDNSRYPSSDEGLAALMTAPGNATNWHGPYIQHAPRDPWTNPYIYVYPGQHNPQGFDLYSTHDGKDTSGNELNNWNANQ